MNIDFRKGFLTALAENGLTPTSLDNYLEKKAIGFGPFQVEQQVDVVPDMGSIGKLLLDVPLALTVGAGAATGIGGAYAVNKMFGKKEEDLIQDAKNEDLSDELSLQIEKIKRRLQEKGIRKYR